MILSGVNIMSKTSLYGPEADAAALRAALQCGITPEKMHDFKKLVFKTFGIRGPHSYRRIKTALQIAGAIDILVETVAEHDDRDELSDFVVSFLNLHKRQEKLRDDDSLSLVESEGDFFSNEPQNQLQIIDCELKNCMLAEEQQLIKYFELPQLSFAQLRHDFDYAHHLQFLNEIEDIKTLLFLGKQETGLLACKYLSAWITQELEEELDEDEYRDLIGKMPRILLFLQFPRVSLIHSSVLLAVCSTRFLIRQDAPFLHCMFLWHYIYYSIII